LADHQLNETWKHKEIAECLLKFAEIFNDAFDLQISDMALCITLLSSRTLGHYYSKHNGFGLKNEIAINSLYLDAEGLWDVLGTLLHEMLHLWQQQHGKPGKGNYHNSHFRNKARALGLIVDQAGHQEYAAASPFRDLLQKHGVEMPAVTSPMFPYKVGKGNSKLKKWTCGCTNARVAVGDFDATCNRCGNKFVRAGQI